MKTTFELPDGLMAAAMKTGFATTKTATVIYALEQLVRISKLSKLRAMRGTVPDFSLDLDVLRSRA